MLSSYRLPSLIHTLDNQLWSCFCVSCVYGDSCQRFEEQGPFSSPSPLSECPTIAILAQIELVLQLLTYMVAGILESSWTPTRGALSTE